MFTEVSRVCAGAQQLPAVTTDATATATLSFNEDSQNITYYLDFNNVPQPVASHIHVNAGPGENGSVGVPLWNAVFAPVPGAGPVSGRVASNTATPTGFVGPLEVSDKIVWAERGGSVQLTYLTTFLTWSVCLHS